MTESFLGSLREFVLAQAQECFWQQAVMRELRARLIMLSARDSQMLAKLISLQKGHTRTPSSPSYL